jgi:predicted DNA-binding transcriptional regulator AlpA
VPGLERRRKELVVKRLGLGRATLYRKIASLEHDAPPGGAG